MLYYIAIAISILATTQLHADVLIEFTQPIKITDAAGKDLKPAVGLDLANGSKIKTEAGGSAILMDDSGAIEEVKGGQIHIVGEVKPKVGQKTLLQGVALALKEATSGGEGTTVYGMVKIGEVKRGIVRPPDLPPYHGIYPSGITIEPLPQITFKWKTDVPRNNIFIVIDDKTNNHILTKKVDFNSGSTSLVSPKFKAGMEFTWYLAEQKNGNFKGIMPRNRFRILSLAKKNELDRERTLIQKITKSNDGRAFLLGQLYYQNRMLDKTIEMLLPLYKKQPTELIEWYLISSYYGQGQMEEADALGLKP